MYLSIYSSVYLSLNGSTVLSINYPIHGSFILIYLRFHLSINLSIRFFTYLLIFSFLSISAFVEDHFHIFRCWSFLISNSTSVMNKRNLPVRAHVHQIRLDNGDNAEILILRSKLMWSQNLNTQGTVRTFSLGCSRMEILWLPFIVII